MNETNPDPKETYPFESKDVYRILIPSEWEALKNSIPKTRLRIVIETLLFTGMRYSELERFAKNLAWFDTRNNAISLPAKATKTQKTRIIHLTPQFSKDLSLYLREHKKLEVPTIRSMEANLLRWYRPPKINKIEYEEYEAGLDFWRPSPKTFRKTWESLLLKAGYPISDIIMSMGHSPEIAYKHYMNLDPRLKSEMELVRKLTEGWGT